MDEPDTACVQKVQPRTLLNNILEQNLKSKNGRLSKQLLFASSAWSLKIDGKLDVFGGPDRQGGVLLWSLLSKIDEEQQAKMKVQLYPGAHPPPPQSQWGSGSSLRMKYDKDIKDDWY